MIVSYTMKYCKTSCCFGLVTRVCNSVDQIWISVSTKQCILYTPLPYNDFTRDVVKSGNHRSITTISRLINPWFIASVGVSNNMDDTPALSFPLEKNTITFITSDHRKTTKIRKHFLFLHKNSRTNKVIKTCISLIKNHHCHCLEPIVGSLHG